jgi:molybdopterin synthase sulfur carrier subunit
MGVVKKLKKMASGESSSASSLLQYITIKVLFFAAARELAQTTNSQISLPVGEDGSDPNTQQLREVIASKFPKLAEQVETITLAVNKEYIEDDKVITLKDGDEVALIPPISGG